MESNWSLLNADVNVGSKVYWAEASQAKRMNARLAAAQHWWDSASVLGVLLNRAFKLRHGRRAHEVSVYLPNRNWGTWGEDATGEEDTKQLSYVRGGFGLNPNMTTNNRLSTKSLDISMIGTIASFLLTQAEWAPERDSMRWVWDGKYENATLQDWKEIAGPKLRLQQFRASMNVNAAIMWNKWENIRSYPGLVVTLLHDAGVYI